MDGRKRTAQRHLIEAILDNEPDRARAAIEAGACPSMVDHEDPGLWRLFSFDDLAGSFLLYEAVTLASKRKSVNDVRIIRVLLEHGAFVSQTDDQGYSAAHKAAATNQTQALKLLIASDADVSLPSCKGYTPIHTAIFGNARSCLNLLLASGARLDLSSHYGKTPLEYAQALDRKELQALIEAHMAMRAMQSVVSIGGISGPLDGVSRALAPRRDASDHPGRTNALIVPSVYGPIDFRFV